MIIILLLKILPIKNFNKRDDLIEILNNWCTGKNNNLVLTIPIVFYSISYYKNLIMPHSFEEPEKIISSDNKIILSILIWLLLSVLILYTDFRMF